MSSQGCQQTTNAKISKPTPRNHNLLASMNSPWTREGLSALECRGGWGNRWGPWAGSKWIRQNRWSTLAPWTLNNNLPSNLKREINWKSVTKGWLSNSIAAGEKPADLSWHRGRSRLTEASTDAERFILWCWVHRLYYDDDKQAAIGNFRIP